MMDHNPLLELFEQEQGNVIGSVDPVLNDLERGVQGIDDVKFHLRGALPRAISDDNPGALPSILWDANQVLATDNPSDSTIHIVLFNDVVLAMSI